jgi:hypothetical protein
MHIHPLELDDADFARLDQALAALRAVLGPLEALTAEERTRRFKMGPNTEAFCRHALELLELNSGTVPPAFELARMRERMTRFDQLRAREAELARMARLLEDARTRVGMERATQARKGYKAMRWHDTPGLQPLRENFRARYARAPRPGRTDPPAE